MSVRVAAAFACLAAGNRTLKDLSFRAPMEFSAEQSALCNGPVYTSKFRHMINNTKHTHGLILSAKAGRNDTLLERVEASSWMVTPSKGDYIFLPNSVTATTTEKDGGIDAACTISAHAYSARNLPPKDCVLERTGTIDISGVQKRDNIRRGIIRVGSNIPKHPELYDTLAVKLTDCLPPGSPFPGHKASDYPLDPLEFGVPEAPPPSTDIPPRDTDLGEHIGHEEPLDPRSSGGGETDTHFAAAAEFNVVSQPAACSSQQESSKGSGRRNGRSGRKGRFRPSKEKESPRNDTPFTVTVLYKQVAPLGFRPGDKWS